MNALPLFLSLGGGMIAHSFGDQYLSALGAGKVGSQGKSLAIAAAGNLYRVAGHSQDIALDLVADLFAQELGRSRILKLYLICLAARGI